jgi:hypothetical protein
MITKLPAGAVLLQQLRKEIRISMPLSTPVQPWAEIKYDVSSEEKIPS